MLEPGGSFLTAVHGAPTPGEEHVNEFMGARVDMTVRLTTPAAFATLVERAGLGIEQLTVRPPYKDEYPTTRIYLEAHASAMQA